MGKFGDSSLKFAKGSLWGVLDWIEGHKRVEFMVRMLGCSCCNAAVKNVFNVRLRELHAFIVVINVINLHTYVYEIQWTKSNHMHDSILEFCEV